MIPSHRPLGLLISKFDYHDTPDKDYVGLDSFEFLVSVDGKDLRIYYQVKEFSKDENPNYVGYCNWDNQKYYWKISESDFDSGTQDYAVWLRSSELSSLVDDNSSHTQNAINLIAKSIDFTRARQQLALNTQSPTPQRVQPRKGSTHTRVSEAPHGSFSI